ncbi:DNA (cytosine-5)-methyltransferase 1B [Cryptomeria japonica]|uniref:DNA (cytosine-5)-methyltransferase 1B n=1 Tax=Cryptomeria japonica TaxID=3369 RepID=UPI0027DA9978|nr:DNA (cytosine-5)-methyltransferase 1B [Cryptomeria japonica]
MAAVGGGGDDLIKWEKQGGIVMQKTATNGRIRRTYIAPTGEKFYSWKDCVKYLASDRDSDSSEDMGRKRPRKEEGQKQADVVEVQDEGEPNRTRKRPKRAATVMNYKEKRLCLDGKDSMIEAKEEVTVEEEELAISLTVNEQHQEEMPPQRRLVDFIIHDSQGASQPIEMVYGMDLYISGLILPKDGLLDKSKGVRCEGFGVVGTWSITGYENGSPIIWLQTEVAEYMCVKPAGSYKKFFSILNEKAMLCVEVYKALSKPDGGNPELGLDELVARVTRSMSSNKSYQGRFLGRDFILSQGDFIVKQLTGLDSSFEDGDQIFTGLPALVALEQECLESKRVGSVGIIINESSASTAAGSGASSVYDEDEKLARLIQEENDWEAAKPSRKSQGKKKFYVKINEDEIANDYPLPAFYKATEDEMDEYLFYDDSCILDPEDLPRRMLHDWSLYNSDSRLVPLELLPMLGGTETDTAVFGSGVMTEDDGSGYCLDADSGGGKNSNDNEPHGIRIYLSAIKEWMIEFGANMLFISIRTDGAWYRLGKPSKQYSPWYKPVLKTARLAIKIIVMLKEQSRVSKLSFSDVIRKLASQDNTELSFISSNLDAVERYVVVHGQIILQQFAEYPDECIQRSAFVTGLSTKMEQRHHTKLFLTKKGVIVKGKNLNPRASARPETVSKQAMRATTTKLINRIWSEYYSSSASDEIKEENGENGEKDEDEQNQEDSEDDEETDLIVVDKTELSPVIRTGRGRSSSKDIKWVGQSVGKTSSGEPLYKMVSADGDIAVGSSVLVYSKGQNQNSEALPTILFVEYMYEKSNGTKMIHGRVLQRGSETLLGNAANPREVFMTHQCLQVDVKDVKETMVVEIRLRSWGYQYRKGNLIADEADRARAIEMERKKLPVEYFCKSLYAPNCGAFLSLPYDTLGLGNGQCQSCRIREDEKQNSELYMLQNNDGFKYEGVEYYLHDFIYVDPEQFAAVGDEKEPLEKFKASGNRGLRSYAVCQILEIKSSCGLRKSDSKPTKIKARRFFRPDDVGLEKAYTADIREVYYSDESVIVEVDAIRGKCVVMRQQYFSPMPGNAIFEHIFFCSCIYDPIKGALKQLPANIKLSSSKSTGNQKGKFLVDEVENAKRKGKAVSGDHPTEKTSETSNDCRLSTLDIFAGCGGLSEGLEKSGASFTKWAIEYEEPAAEAFKLNHPEAEVFCQNCNVILRSIMEKGGDIDDCISTSEAIEQSSKLTDEQRDKLPLPGQVDFINGGPPCQGFSGMNRFNQRTWSKVQCEMILAFLSYADYFRPKFFLLENVRNFVSFNKGQTFRLTLASLLEMGYQVRFGVLQAGNYGVSQSRKRAFIWAASPDESLPEWPEPMHVFASSQIKISLPGGLQYAAIKDAALGAPFRSITVRDTIGDLPPVGNGADKLEITYGNAPVSWFQKQIRHEEVVLYDHISKEMNELNLIRCQRVPKCCPGADWRNLPEEKVKLSTGQIVDLIPWCLPNTAKRHNQWKGLFGRLDWEGNFPTSITDPQPMGKVGMCFHPDQDRIVTVRECARSQGFPDSYRFCGSIHSKHRQIGNAVPPPLAMALGKKLKEVIDSKK